MISFPRTISVDPSNSSLAVFFPIPEIEELWANPVLEQHTLAAGEVVDVAAHGLQLDISVNFTLPATLPAGAEVEVGVNVFASATDASAKTTVTFRATFDAATGGMQAHLTAGHTQSASAGPFTLGPAERLVQLRVLVDRSIVEAFAQGGRALLTKRVYPALGVGAEGVQLFNSKGPAVAADVAVREVTTATPLPGAQPVLAGAIMSNKQ
jgi:beta-fructofuranosidase